MRLAEFLCTLSQGKDWRTSALMPEHLQPFTIGHEIHQSLRQKESEALKTLRPS